MKRKVIVIGMDNTGKTTLCQKIKELKGGEIFKSSGPSRTRDEMLTLIKIYLEKEEFVILERFAIFEEMIYGKVIRNQSKFKYKDSDLLKLYNPLIIYCRPSKKKVLDFGNREQMEGVMSNGELLLKKWDHLFRKLKINRYDIKKYNYEKDEVEKLLKEI